MSQKNYIIFTRSFSISCRQKTYKKFIFSDFCTYYYTDLLFMSKLIWLKLLKSKVTIKLTIGSVGGPNRSTTCPSLSTTNFVKFHLMKAPIVPPFLDFMYFHRGWALSPLTSTLLVISKVTLNCLINSLISASVPGSCPPNWLHGNPMILRPFSEYFSYNSVNWE